MKLQRTTLILILVAFGFAGVVYLVEVPGRNQQKAYEEQQREIFGFPESQVQGVKVMTRQETLIFQKQSQAGQSSWVMVAPNQEPASDAAIAFLLSKLIQGRSDRTLTATAIQLKEYGLQPPMAVVEITLDNRRTHQLFLGKSDFSNSSLYAQVDPFASKPASPQLWQSKGSPTSPPSEAKFTVLLVPQDLEYAVNRPLSEWLKVTEESSPSLVLPLEKTSPLPTNPPTGENSSNPSPLPTGINPNSVPLPSNLPPESINPNPSPLTQPTPNLLESPAPSVTPQPAVPSQN